MGDRTSEHPLPDRRTVLGGASAAALGVSALMLPTAAAAVSPGGQGGAGVFDQIGADITVTTTGIASDANVRRSFTHGGKRYFLDRTNYQLLQFNSAGTFEQLVTIANPPVGRRSKDPSSFLVHEDAAYLAMTRDIDVSGTATPHLSVMRIDLSTALEEEVVATYWNQNLLTAGVWGARTIDGTSYPNVSSGNFGAGVSALVIDSFEVLHCVMTSRSDVVSSDRAYFIDFFNIPADFSNVPGPVNLYASTAVPPTTASRANAVTVGSYSIFFDDSQRNYPNPNPALRVPADPGSWSLLPIPRPDGYYSIDFYNNEDRTMVVVGDTLWALADYYTTGFASQGAMAVGLDLTATSVTAAADPSLPITTLIPIPSSKWSLDSMASDGTNLYLTYESASDAPTVARIALTGTGVPTVDGTVPVARSRTMQGMESGAIAATADRTFVLLGNVSASS